MTSKTTPPPDKSEAEIVVPKTRRKVARPTKKVVQPVHVEAEPEKVLPADPEPQEHEPTHYWVSVRNSCPWATVQSAGTDWGRVRKLIPATDDRLAELQACEHLTVTPFD